MSDQKIFTPADSGVLKLPVFALEAIGGTPDGVLTLQSRISCTSTDLIMMFETFFNQCKDGTFPFQPIEILQCIELAFRKSRGY